MSRKNNFTNKKNNCVKLKLGVPIKIIDFKSFYIYKKACYNLSEKKVLDENLYICLAHPTT